MVNIAIIGGTGFSEKVEEYQSCMTDYGQVDIGTLELGDKEVFFAARHKELEVPHLVNYRANIQALKMQGVDTIYAVSAAGRLGESVWPGHLGAVEDVDWDDLNRVMTFAEKGLLLHASMDEIMSPKLRQYLSEAWDAVENQITEFYMESQDLKAGFCDGGTYFNIQGPAFTTPAREKRLRTSVVAPRFIGQTIVPEAHLAREMAMSYAVLAMCVDHSNYPGAPTVHHADGVMHAVVKTAEAAVLVLDEAIRRTPEDFYHREAHNAFAHSLHESQVVLDKLRKKGRNNLADILEREIKL